MRNHFNGSQEADERLKCGGQGLPRDHAKEVRVLSEKSGLPRSGSEGSEGLRPTSSPIPYPWVCKLIPAPESG